MYTFWCNTHSWIDTFCFWRVITIKMTQLICARYILNCQRLLGLVTEELHCDECPQLHCSKNGKSMFLLLWWMSPIVQNQRMNGSVGAKRIIEYATWRFYASHKFISRLRLCMKTSRQVVQVFPQKWSNNRPWCTSSTSTSDTKCHLTRV